MADLSASLARALHAKALAQLAERDESQAAEPGSEPAPVPLAEPAPARAAAPPRAPNYFRIPACKSRSCRKIDWVTAFTRVVATMHACITLEARLAAGFTAAPRATPVAVPRRPDPRRTPLNDIFRKITDRRADRTEIVRQAEKRIDAILAADPNQRLGNGDIFFPLCEELGFTPDLGRLPDALLHLLINPGELKAALAAAKAPDRRATYPP